jgi:hypothetical protein
MYSTLNEIYTKIKALNSNPRITKKKERKRERKKKREKERKKERKESLLPTPTCHLWIQNKLWAPNPHASLDLSWFSNFEPPHGQPLGWLSQHSVQSPFPAVSIIEPRKLKYFISQPSWQLWTAT